MKDAVRNRPLLVCLSGRGSEPGMQDRDSVPHGDSCAEKLPECPLW